MRSIQEILTLKNNLKTRLERISNDGSVDFIKGMDIKTNNIRKRLQILENILEDYGLYQWLFDPSKTSEDVINYRKP